MFQLDKIFEAKARARANLVNLLYKQTKDAAHNINRLMADRGHTPAPVIEVTLTPDQSGIYIEYFDEPESRCWQYAVIPSFDTNHAVTAFNLHHVKRHCRYYSPYRKDPCNEELTSSKTSTEKPDTPPNYKQVMTYLSGLIYDGLPPDIKTRLKNKQIIIQPGPASAEL